MLVKRVSAMNSRIAGVSGDAVAVVESQSAAQVVGRAIAAQVHPAKRVELVLVHVEENQNSRRFLPVDRGPAGQRERAFLAERRVVLDHVFHVQVGET